MRMSRISETNVLVLIELTLFGTQQDSEVEPKIVTILEKNSHFCLTPSTDVPHARKHVARKVDRCSFHIKKAEVNRRSGHDSMVL